MAKNRHYVTIIIIKIISLRLLLSSKNVLFSRKLVCNRMKNYILIIVLGLLVGITSCEKYNQIDNNSTVKVPFILYVGGLNGYIASTNDGFIYNKILHAGNDTCRALMIADTNLVYINKQLYVKTPKNAPVQKGVDVQYHNENMSLVDAINKRVYVVGRNGTQDSIIYSIDNGQTWIPDVLWNVNNPPFSGPDAIKGRKIQSITQTKNGNLYCMNLFGKIHKRIGTGDWSYIQPIGDSLPTVVGTLKQDFFVGSFNDTLVALDRVGNYGAYRSYDDGASWKFMTGLPVGEILFAKQTEFNNTFFVGTKGAGLWRLQGNNFVRTDGGMLPNTHIHGITAKRIVYRTDLSKYFYFAATNNGLYRSENDGYDWVKLSSDQLSEIW